MMFEPGVYKNRRATLKKQLGSGLALFLGNGESPINYLANAYPFRQDSSFLYFFGLATPGLAAVVDVDSGEDVIFGDDITLEDVIWMGDLPKIKERASTVGVMRTAALTNLAETVSQAKAQGRKILYLPPYRQEIITNLTGLLGIPEKEVKRNASVDLIKAVVAQRSTKSEEEIAEIEKALSVSREMYLAAMKMTRPGLYESDIVGAVEGIALARGCQTAFPSILTMNGQIFHNLCHGNKLERGRLLVIDAGASSGLGYASDITRTIPVSGKFTAKQREIYEIVLNGQLEAISLMKPGTPFKDIHLAVARRMASGLKELGLMKGDVREAVAAGAHALFFPHGLGHMLGLDVHDMEGLGENFVGYDETVSRSEQFGLAYLRMARKLQPGFVLTVEPGIYFIPPLVEKWKAEKKFSEFIDYAKVDGYRDFTGVRIEDDVLITEEGSRVLGRMIPKRVKDLAKAMAG
ncbi:MAG: aminopeptidase P family protein [Acidobacteriota bacterium]